MNREGDKYQSNYDFFKLYNGAKIISIQQKLLLNFEFRSFPNVCMNLSYSAGQEHHFTAPGQSHHPELLRCVWGMRYLKHIVNFPYSESVIRLWGQISTLSQGAEHFYSESQQS